MIVDPRTPNEESKDRKKSGTMKKLSIKRMAIDSVLVSLALILSYVEFLLPPISTAFPGIKMGLPNIVIIVALYLYGWKDAVTVSFLRLCLVALLFGNTLTLAYSAAGAVLSLSIMILLKRIDKFSTVGVSIAGGVFHNVGQILVAMLIFATSGIAYYLIVLSITGSIAGVVVGLASGYVLKVINKRNISKLRN